MATAYGYIRVSTDKQATTGISLDAQRAKIQAWIELNGYEFGGIYEDAGISGTKQHRVGLDAVLSVANKGDAIVAYAISRFARSTKHLLEISEELAAREIDMVSVSERIDTTSAAGKMVFRIMAVMAEFERDLIVERVTGCLANKKARGERIGRPRYGFECSNKTLTVNDNEQGVIARVKKLREEGLSWRKIAAALCEDGIKSRTGKVFMPSQLVRMIDAIPDCYKLFDSNVDSVTVCASQ